MCGYLGHRGKTPVCGINISVKRERFNFGEQYTIFWLWSLGNFGECGYGKCEDESPLNEKSECMHD